MAKDKIAFDESFGSTACNEIYVKTTVDMNAEPKQYYLVADNGRGIPIIMDKEKGITKTKMAMTVLNAGSKFNRTIDTVSTGQNGVGSSCTCALSEVYIVASKITEKNFDKSIPDVQDLWYSMKHGDEGFYVIEFNRGIEVLETAMTYDQICEKYKVEFPHGMSTIVLFRPDPQIFDSVVASYSPANLQYLQAVHKLFYKKDVHIIIDGKGVPKTVTTNSEGVLALYEPNGITSEVSLRSGSGEDIYLGTIYKENLRSGERDATKLQLYPLNTFSLRRVARASVTLITPGGNPLANKTVTVRGGVYKNGGYCETALLGSRAGALVSGITGDTYTTDAAGNITVHLDSTQFWSAEKGESSTTALSALDQLEYILEISAIDGDKYYPLLLTVNGKLGVDDVMRTAEGVVSLERVPAGEANKPFIVAQSVDYGLANGQKVDVRNSTGKIGPNSSFKTATLHTTMFLWGEKIANAKNYSLKLADEYGILPATQSSSTKQYPFSSIPVAENDLTLTEATMTTSGWIADGKDVGMKTQLSLNGSLLQEKIMPFRVVDLTRVPKVTEDDRVTGILLTMKDSSGVNDVDFGGVGDSNILKVLTGRLDDLSGPVDTSVFKMIITPSEDPSVFRAMIWAGYNTLEMEDMDYSEDGVALGANVLTQNLEVGVPGTGDLSQMAKGTYNPKGEYKANSMAGKVTNTDLNLQLEGFYEAEIRYNAEKKEWEVFTVGGGFTAGVGVGFTFSVNAILPCLIAGCRNHTTWSVEANRYRFLFHR